VKTLAFPTGMRRYQEQAAFRFDDYWRQTDENYRPFANAFAYHDCLIEELTALPDVAFVPLYELDSCQASGKRVIGLRYDVDSDPVTGLRAARSLARRGVCGSFYLLHTALYYGQMIGDHFVRHAEIEDWALGYLVAGCELGLHNDAFGACTLFGINGAQAVVTEIEWLRSLGATIRGTVAHNSAPAYGADNYEVFVERAHSVRTVRTRNHVILPLGTLSEAELGLTYEGSFVRSRPDPDARRTKQYIADVKGASIRSEAWMRTFTCDSPYREFTLDVQIWLVGKDQWIIAGKQDGKTVYQFSVGLNQVLAFLRQLPTGTRTLFVLHPEYFRA
jgi:hypothetical protein